MLFFKLSKLLSGAKKIQTERVKGNSRTYSRFIVIRRSLDLKKDEMGTVQKSLQVIQVLLRKITFDAGYFPLHTVNFGNFSVTSKNP